MLFNSNAAQGAFVSEPEHLRECMISANSILVISDLFRRTFGDSRIVLSLAYSVYTAASIFLLKIQATVPADEVSLHKMAYCVDVLNCVKSSTPGMYCSRSYLTSTKPFQSYRMLCVSSSSLSPGLASTWTLSQRRGGPRAMGCQAQASRIGLQHPCLPQTT